MGSQSMVQPSKYIRVGMPIRASFITGEYEDDTYEWYDGVVQKITKRGKSYVDCNIQYDDGEVTKKQRFRDDCYSSDTKPREDVWKYGISSVNMLVDELWNERYKTKELVSLLRFQEKKNDIKPSCHALEDEEEYDSDEDSDEVSEYDPDYESDDESEDESEVFEHTEDEDDDENNDENNDEDTDKEHDDPDYEQESDAESDDSGEKCPCPCPCPCPCTKRTVAKVLLNPMMFSIIALYLSIRIMRFAAQNCHESPFHVSIKDRTITLVRNLFDRTSLVF
jgi:hypothetical protein